MYIKSMLIWTSIIILIIANSLLRQFVLEPNIVEKMVHPINIIILCCLIFTISFIFIPKLGKGTKQNYIKMGLLWFLCIIVTGISIGLISGDTITDFLELYDITKGKLWIIVDIFIGITPYFVAKIKRII